MSYNEIEISVENHHSENQIPVSPQKITKYFPDGTKKEETLLSINEHNLEIYVEGQKIFSLVCTNSNLLELVAGRLLSSGIISEKSDIKDIYFCETKHRAFVILNENIKLKKSEATEPTCCVQNKEFFQNEDKISLPVLKKSTYKPEWIFSLAKEFSKDSALHSHTAGTHRCILASNGKTLFSSEDIGRHNALDKAIGFMLLNEISAEEAIIFTSGRVPVDMVEKVIRAKIPVLVSKSVPTFQSVELAKSHNLTLICRTWPDSFDFFC